MKPWVEAIVTGFADTLQQLAPANDVYDEVDGVGSLVDLVKRHGIGMGDAPHDQDFVKEALDAFVLLHHVGLAESLYSVDLIVFFFGSQVHFSKAAFSDELLHHKGIMEIRQ